MSVEERAPAAAAARSAEQPVVKRRRRPPRPARIVLHVFLMVAALGFLAPLALAVYASLRPYAETAQRGYFSLPHKLTLHYYVQVFEQADLPKYFLNTMYIAIPAVILTLFLSSFVAFCIARLKMRGGILLLVIFTAGNLLPPQVLVTPLYQMYKSIPLPESLSSSLTLYDSYLGLVAIHVAFQVGFCVFVLANYMRTIPDEITDGEPAPDDGAAVAPLTADLMGLGIVTRSN